MAFRDYILDRFLAQAVLFHSGDADLVHCPVESANSFPFRDEPFPHQ